MSEASLGPPRVLVAVHSAEGQTARIGEHVAEILTLHGASADVVGDEADPSPAAYDGIVLGDAIHLGTHSKSLAWWLDRHRDELFGRPSALFQVGTVAGDADAAHSATAQRLVDDLCAETGFSPDRVALFAGALAYANYGPVTRRVLRSIATMEGGIHVPSPDHEYTDWAAVEHFASDFSTLVRHGPSGADQEGVRP